MKKTFTLLSLLSVSTLVFSQSAKTTLKPVTVLKNHDMPAQLTPSSSVKRTASPQSIVWSDDFSVSANWTKTAGAGASSADLWVVGTATPTGSFPIPGINSTTKTNGFGLFDSDKLCSGNQIGNLTSNTTIDCSTHPFVMLEFQQTYRRYYDSTFVYVSGNNGSTYTKYSVNQTIGVNNSTLSNPDVVKIDISAVAGGQSQVKVRFQFWSPSSLNPGRSGCGYAWMVDDAVIYDLPVNDVAISRAYSDFIYKNGGYYTQIPNTQTMPIGFRAAVENRGSAAQTNVKLTVDINNGSGSVYNQTSNTIASLAYTSKDTLTVATPYMMSSQNGTYTASFTVSQLETEAGSEIGNSTVNKSFSVTDTIFARDNGTKTDVVSPNQYVGGDAGSEIGNVFEISAPAVANSVSVFLDASTDLNTAVFANIYKLNLNGDFDQVAVSGTYFINSASDVGKWVTLATPGTILDKDSTYLASIVTAGSVSSSTNAPVMVVFAADIVTQQPTGATLMYIIGDDNWYYETSTPMIRLNIVNTITGVKNLDQNNGVVLGQNAPNPFTRESSVNYMLATDANSAVFTVTDVMGRIISSEKANTGKGTHSIKLGAYAAGIYYYSLNVDGKIATKKMIVE